MVSVCKHILSSTFPHMPQFRIVYKNSENYELVYMHKFQYKVHGLTFLETFSSFRIVGFFLIVFAYTTFCDYLISNFYHVLNVVCFLLGNSSASECYMPTFRNTLFHLHRRIGVE
jgi:hypothetical protein